MNDKQEHSLQVTEAPPGVFLPGGSTVRPAAPTPPSHRKKGHAWITWLVLLVIAVVGYFLLSKLIASSRAAADAGAKKQGKGQGPVPVVVAPARRGDLPIFLNGLGSATAYYTVTVKTRVDGEIMTVNFKEGQMVNKGDLLIEIDPRPYQVQLEQAQGQMARDQATLDNAKVDQERYKILFQQDSIPQQQLATQEATVKQDQGVILSDQSAIDNAKLQLVYAKITAPISGRIGLRLVDPGNVVHATDTTGLAVITQLQPIAVLFTISEDHLPEIMKKMHSGGALRVEAYDRDQQKKIATGTLETIDNQIDQSSGTVKCKGVFANTDNALFPNQFVNARLLIDTLHNVILVPAAAIQRSPESTFVYVVKPDKTVEVRDVTLGPIEADQQEIDKGLNAGEVVVTDGVDKLQSGSKVVVGGPRGQSGGLTPAPQNTETAK